VAELQISVPVIWWIVGINSEWKHVCWCCHKNVPTVKLCRILYI